MPDQSANRLAHPRSWPIAVKLSITLLAAAVLPLVLGVYLNASGAHKQLDRGARENLELLAGVTAARLDQLIDDTRRTIGLVGGDESVIALCEGDVSVRDAVHRRLMLVLHSNPDYSSVFVTDASGKGIAATSENNLGMDFTFREYLRRAAAGETYVSEMLVGKTSAQPGIYFSMPVRRSDNSPILGVAVLKLEGSRVWEIVEAVRVGDRGFAMLSDRNGIVLAHADRTLLYHSFGELPADKVAALNPEESWSRPDIPSLGAPALMGPLTDPSSAGSVAFEAPTPVGSTNIRPWIAGYARMRERDWKVSVVQPIEQFAQPISDLLQQQAVTAVAVALLAGVLAVWRARTVVKPVLNLTGAANRLAAGDFESRATVSGGDEIGRLGQVFNQMVPRLKESVEIQKSLAVAVEVQKSLLPAADPKRHRLDVAGRSRYCDAAGGDYFDFLEVAPLAGSATFIAVGDVVGHGIAAALLMASARAALRARAALDTDLGALMTGVNLVLAKDARHNQFMTLALVVIDPDAGTARWASAGHDPTIVYHPATGTFQELEGGELPLGILEDTVYSQFSRAGLKTGDILVIGTDGIWEMPNAQKEQFGKDRLRAIIREHHARPASEIAAVLDKELICHRKDVSQKDDVTYVIVRILGS